MSDDKIKQSPETEQSPETDSTKTDSTKTVRETGSIPPATREASGATADNQGKTVEAETTEERTTSEFVDRNPNWTEKDLPVRND